MSDFRILKSTDGTLVIVHIDHVSWIKGAGSGSIIHFVGCGGAVSVDSSLNDLIAIIAKGFLKLDDPNLVRSLGVRNRMSEDAQ